MLLISLQHTKTTHTSRRTPLINAFDIQTTNQEVRRYNLRQRQTIKPRDSDIECQFMLNVNTDNIHIT